MSAPHSEDGREGVRGRPGAMTVAMNAAAHTACVTVLRMAVVKHGRIVHERLVRRAGKITVGSRETNDIVVSGENIPRSITLFSANSEEFLLHVGPAMTGRVSTPTGVTSLEDLRARQSASATTEVVCPLPYRARGKLLFGDVSVLFEVIDMPVAAARPQLPASVRGNFAKSIDWLFTAFVIFSFLGHFGFVIYLENADFPLPDPALIVRDFAPDLIIEAPPPPIDTQKPQDDDDMVPTPDPKVSRGEQTHQPKRGRESDQAPRPSNDATTPSEDIARMTADARRDALLAMVGAIGGEGSVVADLLKDGAAVGNAQEIFDQVRGATIAQTGTAGLIEARGPSMDDTHATGLGNLAATAHGHELAAGAPIVEGEIKGRVSGGLADDIGGTGEFDSALVTAEIKRRIGAVRACYEHGLRKNGTLQGKISISLTIRESGSVSDVRADEDTLGDTTVTRCVENAIGALRFRTGPKGGAVTFSYPFVFAPQN